MDYINRENARTVVDRERRAADLVEREAIAVNEEAQKVFDQIKPDEPPPPIKPPDGDNHGHNLPDNRPFSPAAMAISLAFMAGGVYLFVIGFRAIRLELARVKGGKS